MDYLKNNRFGQGRLFFMRKHQYRKYESNDSNDKHTKRYKVAVCNVLHKNPSPTM